MAINTPYGLLCSCSSPLDAHSHDHGGTPQKMSEQLSALVDPLYPAIALTSTSYRVGGDHDLQGPVEWGVVK
jgi:hypothetical protein